MAKTADIRAWAADNGWPELRNGRGRLPDDVVAAWENRPRDDYGPGASPEDFVTAGDPPPANGQAGWAEPAEPAAGDAQDDAADAGQQPQEEPPTRPHRQATARARGRGRLPWHRPPKTARPKRERPQHRRVSVAPLIEETYTDLGSAAAAIPPLQRLLYAQAPVAGVILDQPVKGTIVDRVLLQPAARNYDRMKAGMALVGTPMMLMGVLATAPQPVVENGQLVMVQVIDPESGAPVIDEATGAPVVVPRMHPPTVQHASAMLGLRYCVRAMADLSGGALDRVRERAEANEAREGAVDEFIAFILGQPAARTREEEDRNEGAAAGLKLAGVSS